jgi:hypothetical protein
VDNAQFGRGTAWPQAQIQALESRVSSLETDPLLVSLIPSRKRHRRMVDHGRETYHRREDGATLSGREKLAPKLAPDAPGKRVTRRDSEVWSA